MTTRARTALLIGASRGLGLGLAEELFRRDWRVIGTARDPARATALQALAGSSNGDLEVRKIDVDRADDLEALVQQLSGRRLDLLLVNAGISGPAGGTVETATREEVAQILWTNALAPIRIATRLLPQVVEGGTVAFMSSIMGSISDNTSGGYELYRISKASLNMLAQGFSATHAQPSGITVLSLHPGWVRTDMGGPDAPLDIAQSVRGLANVLETRRARSHFYLDYQGKSLPW